MADKGTGGDKQPQKSGGGGGFDGDKKQAGGSGGTKPADAPPVDKGKK